MTLAEAVRQIIINTPFLEESLNDGIINVSSLARKIKPDVEELLGKNVKQGALVMAINRLEPSYYYKVNIGVKDFISTLGDIIVRSGLTDFTFAKSNTLESCKSQLMQKIAESENHFVTISQGIQESTLIVSSQLEEEVSHIFSEEKKLSSKSGLSSITIQLDESNVEISGIYYYIFKKLAWVGINIVEVISTTNEFTIVVAEEDIDQSFSILMGLKKKRQNF